MDISIDKIGVSSMTGLKERHMRKWGYVIKDVEYDNVEYGGEGVTVVKHAYTPDGHFDGSNVVMESQCYFEGFNNLPLSNLMESQYAPGLLSNVLDKEMISTPIPAMAY